MAYTKRACHECGFRDIQPNMHQRTIQVKSGKSKSSVSAATFVGAALGNKRSERAIGNAILNTGQRTYTRNKVIFLCDECSGAAAARRAKLEKEKAQQEKAEAYQKERQALAEKREIAAEARVARRASEKQAKDDYIRGRKLHKEQEKRRRDEITAQEKRSRSDLRHQRAERTRLLKQQLANKQLDAKEVALVKTALRAKPLIFVRTLVEAVAIAFVILFASVFAFPTEAALSVFAALLLGFILYTLGVYGMRARKTTSARRLLLDESA